ncbi:MAG: S-layer homology domain-containing protein [Megasphaera sp.]|nr:S-layer homology domain-containing protein [Megasphaera sp.]
MKKRMSKNVLAVMTFIMAVGVTISGFAAPSAIFYDVPVNDWSYSAIKQLTQEGVVSGDVTRFDGKRTVTRYEMSILVANAMTKIDEATPEQKRVIEKLAVEYAQDLEKIGAVQSTQSAPAAVKSTAKPNVNFFFDNRIEYTHNSLGNNSGGAWVTGKNIKNSDQLMERIRVYMSADVGDRWTWNSRLVQAKWNWQSNTSETVRFDRFWMTGKNMLGGTLEIGKMQLYPGKGAFFGNTGDTEGVYYTRKQDKWTFRGGLANSSYLISSGQRVKFMEAQYKPNGKMDIGAYALRQSYSDTVDDLDLRVINGAIEITPKLALSFEYAHNNANPSNYAYGHASGKQNGYFIALQSKYKATNYMPALYTNMVNPFKQGDWGWGISYRHLPSGVAGLWNRGAFSWVPLTTDVDGNWQNALDGINAWRADFVYVPWRNVQWTLTYDRIKYIDGDKLNNSWQSTFNFFF